MAQGNHTRYLYWGTHWGRDKLADIFQTTFSNALNENVWIPIKISLNFVPKGRNNNIPALVQIKAWRRSGDKSFMNQWWLVHRRIYASLGLNELRMQTRNQWDVFWRKTIYTEYFNMKYYRIGTLVALKERKLSLKYNQCLHFTDKWQRIQYMIEYMIIQVEGKTNDFLTIYT